MTIFFAHSASAADTVALLLHFHSSACPMIGVEHGELFKSELIWRSFTDALVGIKRDALPSVGSRSPPRSS